MVLNAGAVPMMLQMPTDDSQVSVFSITLFVALLCVCIVLGHPLEKYRWVTESNTAIVTGLITGIILLFLTSGSSSHILVFNEELFFIYVLPQIIFNAGFQVKKKQFFRNFMTIVSFGVVGTLISFAIISLGAAQLLKNLDVGSLELTDYLAIGAIFSATDSVCTLQVLDQDKTPLLYSLVFGEGVVNDATSVVTFNALQKFALSRITADLTLRFGGSLFNLFLTSTVLGIAVGLLSAYILKKLYFGSHSTDREIALMILMSYLSYMIAEMFSLSGIYTVFFCGIVMSHYTWHNVTDKSRVTTKHGFATLSRISEIFIFLYVGMDALDIEKWKVAGKSPLTCVAVSAILLFLVMVSRAAFVFPLSFISNLVRSANDKISFKHQFVMWWAGLMRGAVSMALAYNQFTRLGHTQLRGNSIMITSTISVVLFSNVVFGLITKPLVSFLLPEQKQSSAPSESEFASTKPLLLPLVSDGGDDLQSEEVNSHQIKRLGSLSMFLKTPTNTAHYYWRKFDNAYMRPIFGGRFVPQVEDSPSELN